MKPSPISGFTLIEMMMVLAVMGIAAAVAIPSITDMRRAGSEARAAAALKGELMPACLAYQQIYDATRDRDDDQVGDFPLHPACLAGAQAGLADGGAYEGLNNAIATNLLDRGVWGNASAKYNGAPAYYSNQQVSLKLPGAANIANCYFGTAVSGYNFGFLCGGVPNVLSTTDFVSDHRNDHLRDLIITAYATPSSTAFGTRSFAMSINPNFYRGLIVQTRLPEGYLQYATYYLSTDARYNSLGLFYSTVGYPVTAASAATGGVDIPTPMRLNPYMAKQMQ